MPLIQRLVHAPPPPDPSVYKRKAEQVLDAQTSSTIVGLLSQINDLAAFACNISENLFAEAKTATGSIEKLRTRTDKIQEKLSVWEEDFRSKTPAQIAGKAFGLPTGKSWHRKDLFTACLFDPTRTPSPLLALRAQAQPPPNLGLLDQFNKDGKKCLASYSNPAFFLDQWIEGEMAKFTALQEARKEKAANRKKTKKQKQKVRAQVAAVNIKVFSAQGAEFQTESVKAVQVVGGNGLGINTGEDVKEEDEEQEETGADDVSDIPAKMFVTSPSSRQSNAPPPSNQQARATGPPNPLSSSEQSRPPSQSQHQPPQQQQQQQYQLPPPQQQYNVPPPSGPPSPFGGSPPPPSGPPNPFGGPPSPYGAVPNPFAGPPSPYGGSPAPFGGPPSPYGGPPNPFAGPPSPYGSPPPPTASLMQANYSSPPPSNNSYAPAPSHYEEPTYYNNVPDAPPPPDAPEAPFWDAPFSPPPPSQPAYTGYVAPPERPAVKIVAPGPKRGNLLDEIGKGALLKSSASRELAPPPAKPADGRDDLLSQIRTRNFALKRAEAKADDEKKADAGTMGALKGNQAVMDILARRAAIEQEESESDDEWD